MRNVRGDRLDDGETAGGGGEVGLGSPGKVSLTSRMRRGPSADDIAGRVVQRLVRSSGAPLDAGLRGRFETSLGTDLGGVRVHTGGDAADAAQEAGARAFAHGQDVYFGAGQYQPDTGDGQFLIAHEVAHTVQQQGAAPAPQFALEVSRPGDACEDNADSLAAAMIRGAPAGAVTRAPVQRIAREHGTRGIAESAGLAIADLDIVLEQIAHRIVYHPALTDTDRTELSRWGYHPAEIQHCPGDLSFVALKSARPGVAPVFAFKGTLELVDWIEDANGPGIGMFQFSRNEGAIHAAMAGLGGNATITGHSLGGALAQIAACMYPELVANVITFQAPGIDGSLIDRMRARPEGRRITARHHVVTGDVVSHAGWAHLPGAAIEHTTTDEAIDPATAHRSMPLSEEAEGAGVLDDVVGGDPIWNDDTPRHDFAATAMSTEDPSDAWAELGRRGIGTVAADHTEEAYVVAWLVIRREAEAGTTLYQALVAQCEIAGVHDGGMRENLDALFPELRAASALEDQVRAGTIASPAGFVAAVDRTCPLDDVRRVRIGNYFRTIVREAGLSELIELGTSPLRLKREASGAAAAPTDAHAIAARGAAGGASALPHGQIIQAGFGRHDVGGVAAHLGGEASSAAEALGARAYAFGNDVVFDGAPDLHTAAHEAAHVVQQRAGVHLAGGVGEVGDAHERHADAVADRVVRGESAEALLDEYAPSGGAPAIQRLHDGEGGAGASLSLAVADLRTGFRDVVAGAIASVGGEAGEDQTVELAIRIPCDVVCVTGTIQLSVAHEAAGYRVQARPELGLGLVTGGTGHADLLTGLTLEVRGHDARTAADLLGLALEHEVRALETQPPPAFVCVALAAAAIEFPFLILGAVAADLAARGYNYATTGEASDPFWRWLCEWLFGERHVAAVHREMTTGDYAETVDGGRGLVGGEGGEGAMESGVELSVGGGHHWRAEAGAGGVTEREFDTLDIELEVEIGPVTVGFQIHAPLGGESPPPGQIQVTFAFQSEVHGAGAVLTAEVIAAGLQHLIALHERFGRTIPIREITVDAVDAVGALSSAARASFEAAAADAGVPVEIGAELELQLSTARHAPRTATLRMTSAIEADGAGEEAEYRHRRELFAMSW